MPTHFEELGAKSPDGRGVVFVAPYVKKPDGTPAVMVIVKRNVAGVIDTTLDGQPAIGLCLSEDQPGSGNAPWELGHLLAQQWEVAKKMAGQK